MDEKEIKNLQAMSDEADDEVIVVTITDEEGNEMDFMQEMVIPVGDKTFAVLVGIDDCCEDEECECHHHDEEDDENVIIARIDFDENGEAIYVAPTDEEFAAVQKAYNDLDWEEEEQ